jgi:RHS repeat-associated protein
MPMPGRKYTGAGGYRYGFNGMEKDDDIYGEGNAYTTEFRMYDARLGRWFSVDPEEENSIDESPYVNNSNNPLQLTDPKGDDPISGIVDALIAFGLSAGSDYVSALLEGKSHEEAMDEIGWGGAAWEGIKSYAQSVISPPGVGVAARIYKFSQTKVGKFVAGTVEKMIEKAIYNYDHGLYNDENGEFDFDKVSFKELLIESFKEELQEQATKVVKGKVKNITSTQTSGLTANAKGSRVAVEGGSSNVRRTKHVDNGHISKKKYPEKSKYTKPNQINKIIKRTIQNPDKVTVQKRNRILYQKDFKRKIGTRGETINRTVVDTKKNKIVTSFPSKEFK